MKKADLKSGMVIELRSGDRFLVMRDGEKLTFMNADGTGYDDDEGLDEDMIYLDDDFFDIMRVFNKVSIFNNVKTTNRLLWQRIETKKMTLAEIENALGCKVEVITE